MAKHTITAIVRDKRGRIVSVGRNSYTKTHPLMAKAAHRTNNGERIYLHAEVDALVKLKDWTRAHSMEVLRFHKNGQPALAAPCECCKFVINLTGIKHVKHT